MDFMYIYFQNRASGVSYQCFSQEKFRVEITVFYARGRVCLFYLGFIVWAYLRMALNHCFLVESKSRLRH